MGTAVLGARVSVENGLLMPEDRGFYLHLYQSLTLAADFTRGKGKMHVVEQEFKFYEKRCAQMEKEDAYDRMALKRLKKRDALHAARLPCTLLYCMPPPPPCYPILVPQNDQRDMQPI